MIADPATAPPRPDLAFLRHRARPRPAVPVPDRSDDEIRVAIADFIAGRGKHPSRGPRLSGTATAPAAASTPISFERAGRATAAPGPPAAAANLPTSRGTISFDRAGRGTSTLDMSAPSAPAAAAPPASAARAPSSLDLDATPATPAPPATPTAAGTPGAAAARRAPARPAHRRPSGARVRPGQQHLLSVKDPTVLLTRLQSGIGLLGVEAVCSADVGDLRLGAAYQLRSGPTSTVQLSGGNRFAPSSRRPVIVAGRDEFEHLRLDLRQIRELERVAVYAFSESRAELDWGGTLVIAASGGARVELPLETLYPGRVAVLISLYNVDGELLIRAEMETIAGDVREAARAYGYDRITWRDDRTPVD